MFFLLLVFMCIMCVLFTFSEIKINIKNLNISTENTNNSFDIDFFIDINWYALKYIPIAKTNISKDKLEKLKIKDKIKMKIRNIKISNLNIKKVDKDVVKKIKKYMPTIENINLNLNLGTENALVTAYIVAIVSSILGFVLRNCLEKSNSNKFSLNPIYQNRNVLKINISCIFKLKVIHIIYIIYIIKRGDVKNVRTSNRRTYDYSYE